MVGGSGLGAGAGAIVLGHEGMVKGKARAKGKGKGKGEIMTTSSAAGSQGAGTGVVCRATGTTGVQSEKAVRSAGPKLNGGTGKGKREMRQEIRGLKSAICARFLVSCDLSL